MEGNAAIFNAVKVGHTVHRSLPCRHCRLAHHSLHLVDSNGELRVAVPGCPQQSTNDTLIAERHHVAGLLCRRVYPLNGAIIVYLG